MPDTDPAAPAIDPTSINGQLEQLLQGQAALTKLVDAINAQLVKLTAQDQQIVSSNAIISGEVKPIAAQLAALTAAVNKLGTPTGITVVPTPPSP